MSAALSPTERWTNETEARILKFLATRPRGATPGEITTYSGIRCTAVSRDDAIRTLVAQRRIEKTRARDGRSRHHAYLVAYRLTQAFLARTEIP